MMPILYSFRRCPFAIRARMTLAYAGVDLEIREVLLKDKPKSMLLASPKATVPVLVLADGTTIDESIEVMRWALKQNDADQWWRKELQGLSEKLINECDFDFKKHLDHYKYADRYPEHSQLFYRNQAEVFLKRLEERLCCQRFLADAQLSIADVAIFPFIRQFAMVDKPWFDGAPYPRLQTWLEWFLQSELFLNVMTKYPVWQEAATHE